jgi:hypothetical protein
MLINMYNERVRGGLLPTPQQRRGGRRNYSRPQSYKRSSPYKIYVTGFRPNVSNQTLLNFLQNHMKGGLNPRVGMNVLNIVINYFSS